MEEFLSIDFFGFTVEDVLIVVLFCLLGHLVDKFLLWLINKIIKRADAKAEMIKQKFHVDKQLAQGEAGERKSQQIAGYLLKTINNLQAEILKALKRPLHVFWLTTGCSIGLYIIDIPDWSTDIFQYIFIALKSITVWCVIWFIINILNDIVEPRTKIKAKNSETPIDEVLYPMLITLVKIVVAVVGVLTIFQEFGYSVSTIVAGLGLGGMAVALASKDMLANFFGSFVILLDHPFVLGDWVTISGCEGNIAEIHLRTTKIRTFDDTIVSIPNSVLTNTQIDTRGKYKSKMDCSFGVLYSTTPEQIEYMVQKIENYINSMAKGEDRKYEPKHYVYFSGFGDSSMNITVVAYTHHTSYKEHVKLKHQFLLEIVRIVKEAGTSFAFPTRTLDLTSQALKVELNTPAALPEQLSLPRPEALPEFVEDQSTVHDKFVSNEDKKVSLEKSIEPAKEPDVAAEAFLEALENVENQPVENNTKTLAGVFIGEPVSQENPVISDAH